MTKFYVENGVGKRVVEAINLFTEGHWQATIQHEVHPQMQLPQHGDEWWIEDATKRGYVIVTKDLEIFRTDSERATVIQTGARVIGFARASYTAWQMLGGFAFHWDAIEGQLETAGPWMLKVYRGQTAPALELTSRRQPTGRAFFHGAGASRNAAALAAPPATGREPDDS